MKLYPLVTNLDGSVAVYTDDPHLPKLRASLAVLRHEVEHGNFTPAGACELLGRMADAMAGKGRVHGP